MMLYSCTHMATVGRQRVNSNSGCFAQVSLVMFGTYVYLGAPAGTQNELPPAIAFVCLSLICLLNYNVSTLPSSFNYINQVRILPPLVHQLNVKCQNLLYKHKINKQ